MASIQPRSEPDWPACFWQQSRTGKVVVQWTEVAAVKYHVWEVCTFVLST